MKRIPLRTHMKRFQIRVMDLAWYINKTGGCVTNYIVQYSVDQWDSLSDEQYEFLYYAVLNCDLRIHCNQFSENDHNKNINQNSLCCGKQNNDYQIAKYYNALHATILMGNGGESCKKHKNSRYF